MLLDLINETNDDKEKQEYYELLKTSNEKLAETLYFLNETINIQNNHNALHTEVNIKNVVRKIIENNQVLIREKIVILVNIKDDLLITTIPSYFESIMFNLINNAVKYRSNSRYSEVIISVEKIENTTTITVKDNGIGINLEVNKDKLFGMFKTFHGNDDAVGLGLYMTKNHLEHLNETIDVESEINVGSTFKVIFHE